MTMDNLNDYYDVNLKESRVSILEQYDRFELKRMDIADREGMRTLFEKVGVERVVNLAAQAGVRYSLENPYAYVDANLCGFVNILEC